jgi:hypothetical protein
MLKPSLRFTRRQYFEQFHSRFRLLRRYRKSPRGLGDAPAALPAERPASTGRVWPVIQRAAGEAKKHAASATSQALPSNFNMPDCARC